MPSKERRPKPPTELDLKAIPDELIDINLEPSAQFPLDRFKAAGPAPTKAPEPPRAAPPPTDPLAPTPGGGPRRTTLQSVGPVMPPRHPTLPPSSSSSPPVSSMPSTPAPSTPAAGPPATRASNYTPMAGASSSTSASASASLSRSAVGPAITMTGGRLDPAAPTVRPRMDAILRIIAIGLIAALVVAVVYFLFGRGGGSSCEGDDAALAGIWDEGRKSAVKGAILGTEYARAEGTWERLGPDLDAYAERWEGARRQACAALDRGERSEAEHRATIACLDRRRGAFKALVDALAQADAATAERAIEAAAALPLATSCTDGSALGGGARSTDPKHLATLRALHEELDAADVVGVLGQQDEALKVVGPLRERAEELGDIDLEAEALGVYGRLQSEAGDDEAAEVTLTRSVWLADQARDDGLLAEHMSALMALLADRRGRPADALLWRPHAETVIARLPAGSIGEAELHAALGAALRGAGEHDEAIGRFERAAVIREALYGAGDLNLSDALIGLGRAHAAKGDRSAAKALYERAASIQEAELGADHPALAEVLGDLARLAADGGDIDTALAKSQRALEVLTGAVAPSPREQVEALRGLAALSLRTGDAAEARGSIEQALAIEEKGLGAEDPRLASTLLELAALDREVGEGTTAREHLVRSLAIREGALSDEDPLIADVLDPLAALDVADGDPRAAIPRLERALTIREGAPEPSPRDVALARYHLAGALRAAGKDRDRQRELATAALEGLRQHDAEGSAEAIAELERWLAEGAGKKSKKKKKKTKKKTKKKAKK
ncbi:MAG: tetratricopeptide repeat protein [Nannocystaceae bacterium]